MTSIVVTFASLSQTEAALRALRSDAVAAGKVRVTLELDVEPDRAPHIEDLLCRFDPLDIVERVQNVASAATSTAASTAASANSEVEPRWDAYDRAVSRPEGAPEEQVYSEAEIAAPTESEDRYDEDSGAGPGAVDDARRGISGFGRSLGLETSQRPPIQAGDAGAGSDLSLTVAPGPAGDEAVRGEEGGEEPPPEDAMLSTIAAHEPPSPSPFAAGSAGLDVELVDEVMHADASPDGTARPERAERGPTGDRAGDRREGAEPDEDRLPSPSIR